MEWMDGWMDGWIGTWHDQPVHSIHVMWWSV